MSDACDLCQNTGGTLLWEDAVARIVRVADADYPGFCRVIWKAHVREMTDLSVADRNHVMQLVFAVERTVRQLFAPDKINLASFGNMTPHLHWHIIPRWQDDRHFPEPVWGRVQREDKKTRNVVSDDVIAHTINETLKAA